MCIQCIREIFADRLYKFVLHTYFRITVSDYDSTLYSVAQYKDAFLKENPTYKWYNPAKHTQPVAVNKSVAGLPSSTAPASNVSSVEQISAGKLAGTGSTRVLVSLFCLSCFLVWGWNDDDDDDDS